MDDWHQRLSSQLLGTAPQTLDPTASAQLEIAFGHARTEVSYLLGLAHTGRLPVTGNVIGDDIGVQLGATVLRFVISRGDGGFITATIPGQEKPARLMWDQNRQSMVIGDQPIDMREYVRAAVEATVAAYKAAPAPPPFTWGHGPGQGPQQG
jgi:hypothetical protein